MPVFVQTNVSSLLAQNNLSRTQLGLSNSFARLSSGYRINSASDDAAGLGISKSFEAQIRSYAVAERNANDAISMAATADGAADKVHSLLQRLRELAVSASNGTFTTTDSSNTNTEFVALRSEIDRIASTTKFNGKLLLSGTSSANTITFQVGIYSSSNDTLNVSFGGVDNTQLALSTSAVDIVANASSAIALLDAAIQSVSASRETFGAAMNRLQSTISNLQSIQTNMSASLSRIRDVDVAAETSSLARSQILAQAGASVLVQANQQPQLALALLSG